MIKFFKRDSKKYYSIYFEHFRSGSEGSGPMGGHFKTKNKAIKYLEERFGKIKPFEHSLHDAKGEWYMPQVKNYVGYRGYCLVMNIDTTTNKECEG